jgi:hypothetical protein
MENVISFTFTNWITVLLMASLSVAVFLVIFKGGALITDKFVNKQKPNSQS